MAILTKELQGTGNAAGEAEKIVAAAEKKAAGEGTELDKQQEFTQHSKANARRKVLVTLRN